MLFIKLAYEPKHTLKKLQSCTRKMQFNYYTFLYKVLYYFNYSILFIIINVLKSLLLNTWYICNCGQLNTG